MERESFIQGGGRLIVINFLLILIVISLILDPFGLNGRTSVTNQRNFESNCNVFFTNFMDKSCK